MEHQIYLFGLNHKTAGVDVREAFALGDRPKLGELLVQGEARVREALVLSTCNRVEVLVADTPGRDVKPAVLAAWTIAMQYPENALRDVPLSGSWLVGSPLPTPITFPGPLTVKLTCWSVIGRTRPSPSCTSTTHTTTSSPSASPEAAGANSCASSTTTSMGYQ